jgi:endonuclease-3
MQSKLLDRANASKAVKALISSYPNAHYYLDFKTDVDLMVAAMISAQTKDEVVNAVTPDLFRRYRTITDYAQADEKRLAERIKRVSFAGSKAKNIIKTCKAILDFHGGKIPRSMDALTSLPGIGRKTANTILINAYGIVEGIPVDTWVIKLSGRIGLSRYSDPEKIEKDLMDIVDRRHWKTIAYVLKSHGKVICQSKIPVCSRCMINKICMRNGVSSNK